MKMIRVQLDKKAVRDELLKNPKNDHILEKIRGEIEEELRADRNLKYATFEKKKSTNGKRTWVELVVKPWGDLIFGETASYGLAYKYPLARAKTSIFKSVRKKR